MFDLINLLNALDMHWYLLQNPHEAYKTVIKAEIDIETQIAV